MRLLHLFPLFAGVLVLAGCPKGKGIEKVDQSALVKVITADKPQHLDPHVTSNGADVKIINQIYDRLLRVNPGNVDELVPDLAKEWTVSDDGKTITFTLKDGVTFHDGAKLDAAAAKLSLDRARKVGFKLTTAPYAGFLGSVDTLEAKGLELTVKLKTANSRVMLRNLASFFASIVSPQVLTKVKDMEATEATQYVTSHAKGTGPFMLDAFDPKANLTRLVANPKYRDGAPAVKTIVFQPMTDPNTRWQTFQKEKGFLLLDDVPRQHWKAVEESKGHTLHSWWALNVCYLGINGQHAKTKEPEVRRIIQLAIDRPALLKHYEGTARPTYSIVAQPFGEYDPKLRVEGWSDDLAARQKQAKELVGKVAGLAEREITIYFPQDSRPYLPRPQDVADTLRQQLGAVGLKVKIQGEQNSKLFESIPSNEYELILIGWMTDNGDADNFYTPLTDGADGKAGALNTSRMFDPEVHDKLVAAQLLTKTDERVKAYRVIEGLLQNRVRGYAPLVNTKQGVAFTSNVEGVEVDPLGAYRLYKVKLKK